MTTAREHFKVTKCTNPSHSFQIGRLLGAWQIANDKWVTMTASDYELVHWVRLGSMRTMDGEKIYELVIGKFMLAWGFV